MKKKDVNVTDTLIWTVFILGGDGEIYADHNSDDEDMIVTTTLPVRLALFQGAGGCICVRLCMSRFLCLFYPFLRWPRPHGFLVSPCCSLWPSLQLSPSLACEKDYRRRLPNKRFGSSPVRRVCLSF